MGKNGLLDALDTLSGDVMLAQKFDSHRCRGDVVVGEALSKRRNVVQVGGNDEGVHIDSRGAFVSRFEFESQHFAIGDDRADIAKSLCAHDGFGMTGYGMQEVHFYFHIYEYHLFLRVMLTICTKVA